VQISGFLLHCSNILMPLSFEPPIYLKLMIFQSSDLVKVLPSFCRSIFMGLWGQARNIAIPLIPFRISFGEKNVSDMANTSRVRPCIPTNIPLHCISPPTKNKAWLVFSNARLSNSLTTSSPSL
jgi:hypothetical protein